MIKKPALFEKGTAELWTDDHISKGMLDAHLNPDWDAATRKHETVRSIVKWIGAAAPAKNYSNLLDLGCGPGIYAEQFCKAGYRVTGMDISTRSIDYAKKSAQEKKLPIEYFYQNFLTMDFKEKFDLVTLIYFDFCVNSPEDRAKTLQNVRAALKPGGLLIIELTKPKYFEGQKEYQKWEYAESGFFCGEPHLRLESFYIYGEDSTFLNQSIIVAEHEMKSFNIWHHAFTKNEFENDLNAAGLAAKSVYGNMMGAEFNENGKEMCFVAMKGSA